VRADGVRRRRRGTRARNGAPCALLALQRGQRFRGRPAGQVLARATRVARCARGADHRPGAPCPRDTPPPAHTQERLKQQKQQQDKSKPDGAASAPAAAPSRAAAPATFVTAAGRALYSALFSQAGARQRAAAVRELFLPRRLAFVYDFDAEGSGPGGPNSELPTTLRRSQADCPAPPDLMPAGMDAAMLGRVGRVVAYVSANLIGKGGQRKPKRKEHVDAIKAILAGSTPEVSTAAYSGPGAGHRYWGKGGAGLGKQQRVWRVDAVVAGSTPGSDGASGGVGSRHLGQGGKGSPAG
jgi:hypothetical protein